MRRRRPGANASFSFEALIRGTKWQARPGIENPQHFSHNVEGIAARFPPASGFERVIRRGVHNRAAAAAGEAAPKNSCPARVNLAGNENHARAVCLLKGSGYCCDFIRGIDDRWIENADGLGRHTFVLKDPPIVEIFSGERDVHGSEGFAGFG